MGLDDYENKIIDEALEMEEVKEVEQVDYNDYVDGVLGIVAKTGGIKFKNSVKWYNPSPEIRDEVLSDIKLFKDMIGKNVRVYLSNGAIYNKIEVIETLEVEESNKFKVKTESSGVDDSIKKHIVNIGNKEFVTFAGLLDLAHKKGLSSITTDLIEYNSQENMSICKARVIMNNGTEFNGIGDASSNNVGAMIKPHVIRMSETRAIARALRWATNIGMASVEELYEEKEENKEDGN